MFLFFYRFFKKTVLKKLTVYYTKIKFVIFLTIFIIITLCVDCLIKKLTFCEYRFLVSLRHKKRPHFMRNESVTVIPDSTY